MSDCPTGLSCLSILARTSHKEPCSRESARPEERTKDVGDVDSRESHIRSSGRGAAQSILRRGAGQSRLGCKA